VVSSKELRKVVFFRFSPISYELGEYERRKNNKNNRGLAINSESFFIYVTLFKHRSMFGASEKVPT